MFFKNNLAKKIEWEIPLRVFSEDDPGLDRDNTWILWIVQTSDSNKRSGGIIPSRPFTGMIPVITGKCG